MASRTAVSALPWHQLGLGLELDVDPRAGLSGATRGRLGAGNRRMALTFRYSGIRNRRYCSSIFHDDARLPLPAVLPPEHDEPGDGEAGVLSWAERNSGDHGALGESAARSWRPPERLRQAGSLGRRRPSRMTRLALTSTGDGGSLLPPPPPGSPKSKSLSVSTGAVVVHLMEKSSPGSMSMNDLELPKEWPRSAASRRSNDGAGALRFSHPREKLSPRCSSGATSMRLTG